MKTIVYMVFFGFALCFAQGTPPKLAIYVSGSETSVNLILSGKLLAAMTQSEIYWGILDPWMFYDEVTKSGNSDIAWISQVARRQGADYVCVVGIIETPDYNSITASLVKSSDLYELKTGFANRPIRSLDDLTAVSDELAVQLLPPGSYVPSPPSVEEATKNYPKRYKKERVKENVKENVKEKKKNAKENVKEKMKEKEKVVVEEDEYEEEEEEEEEEEVKKSRVSFGIRAGINFYKILGLQAGFVVDMAATNWFRIQPGLMYVQKGRDKSTVHYLELPLLLSLKLSALRLNAGPYYDLCLSDIGDFDFGLNTGIGFDIGRFYIGAFYDPYSYKHNRTLGAKLGVNF